jgi:HPr kinase/phosphorylase
MPRCSQSIPTSAKMRKGLRLKLQFMTEQITAQTLFTEHRDALALRWYCNPKHATQSLLPTQQNCKVFASLFNPRFTQQITIFGHKELNQLTTLADVELEQALDCLFDKELRILLFADNRDDLPSKLTLRAEKQRIPVLISALTSEQVVTQTNEILRAYFSASITLHGVFMDVLDVGVFLTGNSGIGKSELALGLINCGHRLVADDAVIFSRVGKNTIIGSCPPLLQDFLEVRGLGIINIRAMFGDDALRDSKRLQLIVKVVLMEKNELSKVNRLEGTHSERGILGETIPEVTIPVAPGRNLAVLVEGAVRNQILKFTGYDARQEFIQRQQKLLEKDSL